MADHLHRPSRPRSRLQDLRRFLSLRFPKRQCLCWILLFVLLDCSLILARYSLSHSVTLDIPSLCAINQKLHSHSRRRSSSSLNTTLIKFSILTLLDGSSLSAIAGRYPAFLESRSLYASLHGYKLRTYFHRLDLQRHLVWSKLLAIHDIFYSDMDSQATAGEIIDKPIEEWVWVLDLDALIFNFGLELQSIVESTGKSGVNIIIASDHHGLNAGSFLVRKSEWTREFLRRWWMRGRNRSVPMIEKLFEQAVLNDLVKTDESVAAHVHVAAIRDFNAYGYPASELYLFQTGDFIVHCPGPTLKKWLPDYAREWERMMQECGLRELWMDAGLQLENEAREAAASNL